MGKKGAVMSNIGTGNVAYLKNGQLTGWVEKREEERVAATIRAYYRIASPAETKTIVSNADYANTTEAHLARQADTASFFRAIHRDIFRSDLTLLSQSTLATGMRLEVTLQFPSNGTELTFLAQVSKVNVMNEWNKDVFHGKLKTLAISQKSLGLMILHLKGKKA
jgi:hypothetical protein